MITGEERDRKGKKRVKKKRELNVYMQESNEYCPHQSSQKTLGRGGREEREKRRERGEREKRENAEMERKG